jgi:hypothetical protein
MLPREWVKLYVMTDGQLASLSWNKAPIRGLQQQEVVSICCSRTVFTYVLLCSVTYLPIQFQRFSLRSKVNTSGPLSPITVQVAWNLVILQILWTFWIHITAFFISPFLHLSKISSLTFKLNKDSFRPGFYTSPQTHLVINISFM